MLLGHVWHLPEDELSGERPKERLHWELVHVAQLQAHRDVVVVLDPLDFSPELELLGFDSALKSVKGHVDLHALVEVESGTVVAEVFQLLRKVQDVHIVLFSELITVSN